MSARRICSDPFESTKMDCFAKYTSTLATRKADLVWRAVIWNGDYDMEQNLSREELVELVETIMSVRDKKTGKPLKGISHPGGSDLIYYPELVGLSKEPTVDEIVDLAIKGV